MEQTYLKMLLLLAAVLGFLETANARETIDIYVCDNCDSYSAMEAIAYGEAFPVECFEGPMLEGGVSPSTDSGSTSTTAQCFAPPRLLIVASPHNEIARKFVVQAPNPFTGHPGLASTQFINVDEQAVLDKLYDLEKVVREALSAINNGTALTLPSLAQVQHSSSVSTQTTDGNVDESCLTSAAAHVFSSDENKRELERQMATALMDEIGARSWNEFTSTLQLSGTSSSNGLTISVGTDTSVSAGVEGTVHYEHRTSRVTLIPVGGESCVIGSFLCDGPDPENVIIYDVIYSGNINSGSINELNFSFVMNLNTSNIDGVDVGMILDRGVHRAENDPDSCLSQFVAAIDETSPIFIDEETLSGPQQIATDEGEITACLSTKSVRACVTRDDDNAQRCSSVVMFYYKLCEVN
ncbi:hypothetical protein [Pseudidiomarina insulisalsae]|uniref:Uncharacterized protein n=1 Tax=Pseudidiomarina insulisalsae TaxID=575789 RepID=A0A432YMR1_9GAMM|nr:hypothetical protein [Pseudidiomarina insulisalsae]RUO62240.1 hypothetical protein CWI71_05160 [Pseudidiomarina insulisalsae]